MCQADIIIQWNTDTERFNCLEYCIPDCMLMKINTWVKSAHNYLMLFLSRANTQIYIKFHHIFTCLEFLTFPLISCSESLSSSVKSISSIDKMPARGKMITHTYSVTVFIRIEAPVFGNISPNLTFCDSYILSHAINIFHKNFLVTEIS